MKIIFEISNISSQDFNYEMIDLCKEHAVRGKCWVNIRKENSFCFAEYNNEKDAQEAFDYINGLEDKKGQKLKVKVVKSEDQVCFEHMKNGSCKAGGKCFYLHKKPKDGNKKVHRAIEIFKPNKIAVVSAPVEEEKTSYSSKPKKEQKEQKKTIVFSTPEPDYFRKAMEALPKEDKVVEQIKPKVVAEKPAISWAEYSTTDDDSFISNAQLY